MPCLVTNDKGVRHPRSAARHGATAIAGLVRQLLRHAPEDVLVVKVDINQVVEDFGDVAGGRRGTTPC